MLVKTNSLIPLFNVCNQSNFWNQNLHQFPMSIFVFFQYVLLITFLKNYFIFPIINVLFSSRLFSLQADENHKQKVYKISCFIILEKKIRYCTKFF